MSLAPKTDACCHTPPDVAGKSVVQPNKSALLKRLARIEGQTDSTIPSVLFLCVHNAGRSQMAAGWFRQLAAGRALVYSGGSEPAAEVNTIAVEAMREVGIDIKQEFPKPWTDEIVRAADLGALGGGARPGLFNRQIAELDLVGDRGGGGVAQADSV